MSGSDSIFSMVEGIAVPLILQGSSPCQLPVKEIMIRSTLCRRGHRLKLGKDGRQRCPICQSKYLRDWRAKQKGKSDEKFR